MVKKMTVDDLTANYWTWAILGRGSTAAYFLDTLDKHDDDTIVVIGQPDPWSEAAELLPDSGIARGYEGPDDDPLRFINHQHLFIAHPNAVAPAFASSNMDRRAWAAANEKVLAENSSLVYEGEVSKVRYGVHPKQQGKDSFIVTINSGDKPIEVRAERVLFALGAGPSRFPEELIQYSGEDYKKSRIFVDVNSFGRGKFGEEMNRSIAERLRGKTVAVIGPNAALDAAYRSLFHGATVNLFVEDGGAAPSPLASQPLVKENIGRITTKYSKNKKGQKPLVINAGATDATITYYTKSAAASFPGPGYFDLGPTIFDCNDKATFDAQKSAYEQPKQGPAIRYEYYVKKENKYDYVVYGMGMDGSPVKKIDEQVFLELEPILDTDQIFGDPKSSILGFQSKQNKSLIALGAVTAMIARRQSPKLNVAQLKESLKVQHAELQRMFNQFADDFSDSNARTDNF